MPGYDSSNVFLLRNIEDAHAIAAKAETAKNIVIIGSGFIGIVTAIPISISIAIAIAIPVSLGLECAAYLQQNFGDDDVNLTVVSQSHSCLSNVFGDRLANVLRTMHEQNGVEFKFWRKVECFQTENNVATAVQTDQELIPADLVIVAIGVKLNTDFVEGL